MHNTLPKFNKKNTQTNKTKQKESNSNEVKQQKHKKQNKELHQMTPTRMRLPSSVRPRKKSCACRECVFDAINVTEKTNNAGHTSGQEKQTKQTTIIITFSYYIHRTTVEMYISP
ncbi:hypothetical protein TCDM_12950 [Trypanosoma cruzi Dm28c]|uniref:Uncharacterized protein n=1 Tax=Trypanosoma cruzi Dm28c TaxID=1416333 RepID=V5APL9_TRYCR|nr:hypothetical protein TCDM_12950 [Trypanosoma cruzi Dm28c]